MKNMKQAFDKAKQRYDQLAGMILPDRWRWHIESALGLNHELGEGRSLIGDGEPRGNFGKYWPITFLVFSILILYFVAGYYIFLDFPYKLGFFTIGATGFFFLLIF